MISETAIIFPEVRLGKNVIVEDFCVIGARFRGFRGEALTIGDNAIIRSHTVIYAGNVIGDNFQTGNRASIRELNKIGDNVSIGTMTVIEHHVQIHDGVRIHSQAFVPEFTTLEKGCWIGPNVVMTNAKYPTHPNAKNDLKGPIVRECARIGANATILPGLTIGVGALVGAGSVVVKDVESGSVVAGNPAKFLKKVHY